jgi:hypothetical protein
VRLANEAGGRDNITCVVVDVLGDVVERRSSDGDRILSAVHGPDRVLAELRESGEHAALVIDEAEPGHKLLEQKRSRRHDTSDDPDIARVQRRSVMTWRVMVFGLVFALIVAAAIGTIIYTGTNTYYVGFEDDTVVIFQGRPGGVLWLDPQLQERTDLTRDEVPPALLSEIEAGKEQSSLEAARQYVTNIEDQITASTSTVPSSTTTSLAGEGTPDDPAVPPAGQPG